MGLNLFHFAEGSAVGPGPSGLAAAPGPARHPRAADPPGRAGCAAATGRHQPFHSGERQTPLRRLHHSSRGSAVKCEPRRLSGRVMLAFITPLEDSPRFLYRDHVNMWQGIEVD